MSSGLRDGRRGKARPQGGAQQLLRLRRRKCLPGGQGIREGAVKIPPLRIGDLTVPLPIIQGGMGVRVSLARLVAAVANEGGIGTIAAVGLGDIEASKLA